MDQWTDGEQTVVHGEAESVLSERIPDASVDLVFADPPYNLGKRFGQSRDVWESEEAYVAWCYGWLELCIRKLRPTGALYVMTSTQAMPYLDLFLRNRMTVLSRIVWHYDSSGVQARKRFGSLYEPILYCVKDARNYTFRAEEIQVEARTGAVRGLVDHRRAEARPYRRSKVPGNVWTFSRVRYRMAQYEDHPTQKPEALLERMVRASTDPGDTVLDPFAGTFTAAAVAKRLGRRSVSIEKEREYVRIGLRRLGLATELDGHPLLPPAKTYAQRTAAPIAPMLENILKIDGS